MLEQFNIGEPVEVTALFASILSIPLGSRVPELEISPQRQMERPQEVLIDWIRDYADQRPGPRLYGQRLTENKLWKCASFDGLPGVA